MSQHGYSPPCKMDTNGVPLEGDVTIDLLIETLTGTAFEMTVSPLDTIAAIKSKIHRIEGIPVSAQHLLYNLHELEDSARLRDCSISNGATLKLVTSMRGGPICPRRFMPSPEERAWMDLVDANRCDNILDHFPSCQLTVLVVCEGEQLNLFRVVENIDGSYSPVSDSISSSSVRNASSADEPEVAAQRLLENTITMGKVQDLQRRLNKGMRHRKASAITEESSKIGSTTLPAIEGRSASQASNCDQSKLTLQLASQPTLRLVGQSEFQSPKQSSKGPAEARTSSTVISPGSSSNVLNLLQCSDKKHMSLPPLVTSECLTTANDLSPAPRSFLPILSVSGAGKRDLTQQARTTSSSRQLRSPPAPRLIPPPAHAPPLRPHWNQRQRPPVLPQLYGRNRELFSPSAPMLNLSMCQTQRKLEPITRLKESTRDHLWEVEPPETSCRHLLRQRRLGPDHHHKNQSPMPASNCRASQSHSSENQPRRQSFRFHKGVWMYKPTEQNQNQNQLSPPQRQDCCLTLLRRPSSCPRETFTENLSASLTRNFSSRYPGVLPENLPIRLSYRLTERLSYCFSEALSDYSTNRLCHRLSLRISDCLAKCLSNRFPADLFGQALRDILPGRRAHGLRITNGPDGCSHTEMLVGQSNSANVIESYDVNNAVRGQRTLPSTEVGVDSLYCPESTMENVRETAALLAQIPRLRSAPSTLPSQTSNVRHSMLANLQQEPLSLHLTDSTLYRRRSSSEISESVPLCPYPRSTPASRLLSSLFLNTIHSGPDSMEYVQRVIESTVQQRSHPVQTHLSGEQGQIQIMNGADQRTSSLALFPQIQNPPQGLLFGPNLTDLVQQDIDLQASHARPCAQIVESDLNNHTREAPELDSSKFMLATQYDDRIPDSVCGNGLDYPSEEISAVPKKPHRRCCQCRKKLTISNKYLCRCQKLFCSMHRYSETHDCNYDYKEEGRKLLQQENPQIMAEKIAKM